MSITFYIGTLQLNWHKDDREGRFLLRRIDDVTHAGVMSASSTATTDSSNAVKEGPEFKRKLSKREKKEMKKQEKLNKVGKGKDGSPGKDGESSVAEKLYTGWVQLFSDLCRNFYKILSSNFLHLS